MSEKKSFDEAIKLIEDNSGWARDRGGGIVYPPDIQVALQVLEAAGKVEKAELKDFIHLYLADLDPNPILEFMETVYMALPDSGKEKL